MHDRNFTQRESECILVFQKFDKDNWAFGQREEY